MFRKTTLMHKYLFTYLLAMILISSIVVPVCLDLCEISYELVEVVDAEEELETKKDVKIFYLNDEYAVFKETSIYNNLICFVKEYSSIPLTLDSPPPEVFS